MTKAAAFFAATVSTVAVLSQAAWAEWPNDKPIEVIVGFAPGGGTDVMIRTLAPYIEKNLPGSRIVIQNRPGASGEITYTALAQAQPDGYTVSSFNLPGFITMQLSRKIGFDPANVEPVTRIVADPTLIVVSRDSPFETFEDLIAYAKENPGALTLGGTGVGGDEHLAMLQIEREADVDMTNIPFNGASEAKTALLGGHIQSMGLNMGEYLSGENERIRPLVQLADERAASLPDVPTAAELGYALQGGSERGFAITHGTPEDIREHFAEAVRKALDDPEFQKTAQALSLPISYLPGDEWKAQLPEKTERLKAIWALTEAGN